MDTGKIVPLTNTGGQVGAYGGWWPTTNPITYTYPTYVQTPPRTCQCGGTVTRESVITRWRRLRPTRNLVAEETHDACVCGNCGVIAWFDGGPQ